MATPIANGCDAFTVPSASAIATTANSVLESSGNWSASTYGYPIAGNMKFFIGYCDVMTSTDVTNLNNAGVSVLIFYENTDGSGPSGTTPGYYSYWTYAQGYYDGQQAQISSVRAGIPLNRPVYFAIDALGPDFSNGADSTNISYIETYFSGVYAAYNNNSEYIGVYTNPYGFGVLHGLGYVSWLCQDESLAQAENNALSPYASLWQLYNGGAFALSNGDSSVDGEFAYQSSLHVAGDFGQYPFSGGGGGTNYATITSNIQSYGIPQPRSILVT